MQNLKLENIYKKTWEEKSVTGLDKDFLDKKLKSIIPRKINKLDLLKLMSVLQNILKK